MTPSEHSELKYTNDCPISFILVYREYQDEKHMLSYCGSVNEMLNNSDKKDLTRLIPI